MPSESTSISPALARLPDCSTSSALSLPAAVPIASLLLCVTRIDGTSAWPLSLVLWSHRTDYDGTIVQQRPNISLSVSRVTLPSRSLLKRGQAYQEAKDLKEENARLEKEKEADAKQIQDLKKTTGTTRPHEAGQLQSDVERLHRDHAKLRQGEAATAAAAAENERLKIANELLLKKMQAQMEQRQYGTDGAATPGFCGWLTTQGSGGGLLGKKNWKTRWVIIKDGRLTYHKPDALGTDSPVDSIFRSALGGPTGPLTLSDCTVSKVKSNVLAGISGGLLLRSDQKELLLQQCHEPARAWLQARMPRWSRKAFSAGGGWTPALNGGTWGHQRFRWVGGCPDQHALGKVNMTHSPGPHHTHSPRRCSCGLTAQIIIGSCHPTHHPNPHPRLYGLLRTPRSPAIPLCMATHVVDPHSRVLSSKGLSSYIIK